MGFKKEKKGKKRAREEEPVKQVFIKIIWMLFLQFLRYLILQRIQS